MIFTRRLQRYRDDDKNGNLLNDFLVSVLTEGTELDSSISATTENVKRTLKDIHLILSHIKIKLLKLRGNKSSGPDFLSALRCCADFDVPLCIFTKAFTLAVPVDWRDANDAPLHKKGPRSDK